MNLAQKIKEYFVSAQVELKKVVWPTKRETYRYSLAVIGVSLGVALFFGLLDFVFNFGLENLILMR